MKKNNNNNNQEYISTKAAAEMSGGTISQATIVRMYDKKIILGIRPAKIRYIHKESFLVFLRQSANCFEARALIRSNI